jgi:cytochrome c-type biogenesis protein CcmE
MEIAEKRTVGSLTGSRVKTNQNRAKFFIGGLLIFAAVAYLIYSSIQSTSQYFLTVKELQAKGASIVGRDVRISGAVIGDSIRYDSKTLTLTFTIANTPGDQKEIDKAGGLAKVLHQAVIDPKAEHIQIVYKGVKPDLLRNEAQAIVTGKLGQDGVFQASELLLKCPTKYEDAVPNQVDTGAQK